MNFLNGKMEPVSSKCDSCIESRVFDFSIEEEDYFLNYHATWDLIEGDSFTVEIGGGIFNIPSGLYLLCVCEDGNSDWIMIDEIIGRDIGIFTMPISMRSFSPKRMRVRDFHVDRSYFPLSRTPVPLTDGEGTVVILASTIDQHSKMKGKEFDIFVV